MGAYDCDCINNLEYDRRERKQKEQSQSTAQSTAQSTDLIDRQAAIDVLSLGKEMLSRVLDDMDVVGTDREKYSWGLGLIESYINDIKELPTVQPELKWIPVRERLPEEPGYYITSSEYGGVTVDFYYDHFWNARKNAYKVLAWMPLPKIYKPNNK